MTDFLLLTLSAVLCGAPPAQVTRTHHVQSLSSLALHVAAPRLAWFTVVFANVAEAMAGRGKTQAPTLQAMRSLDSMTVAPVTG